MQHSVCCKLRAFFFFFAVMASTKKIVFVSTENQGIRFYRKKERCYNGERRSRNLPSCGILQFLHCWPKN